MVQVKHKILFAPIPMNFELQSKSKMPNLKLFLKNPHLVHNTKKGSISNCSVDKIDIASPEGDGYGYGAIGGLFSVYCYQWERTLPMGKIFPWKKGIFIMGKIDTITKKYMGNPIVFADAFNQFLYHGEQKIDPAQLTELDTTEIVIPYGASSAGVPEQKYRDVLNRLIPVIILVIYFVSDSWDAPLSLKEMYSSVDSVILAHAPDYHVNLIAPREMSDDEINEFHSNLREVMLYIKYSKDKKTLNKVVKEDIKFQSMERQAAEVINIVTGSKLKYPEGKGDVNMCQAIQQMREESEIKGAILMCKDLGVSLAETIKRIAEKFQLSENESSEQVKQYW